MMNLLSADGWMLAFWSPGPAEMLVLAVVALLLYGGNLPEVARSWGKTFAEFRRGLSGFQNELNEVIYSEPDQLPYHEESEYPPRDDTRIVDGYEDADDYRDDSAQATDSVQDDSADVDTSNEEGAGQPAADEPAAETLTADENDQTVRDASAETVVIDPDKPQG